MDVKSLYTFIAVVDHGSFAQAAEALELSASAISVQMRGLEADVDLRLFDRSRRPPVLTQEGRDFIDRAREVIKIWEDLSKACAATAMQASCGSGPCIPPCPPCCPPRCGACAKATHGWKCA
jgi:DNA-binding transcriptional LysR family regulator